MEYITGLLSNTGFIMYNKTIAKELGINEAVLLGEFCAKYQYWLENGALIQNDGWFFVTRDDIFLDTGLTDNQQRSALQTLRDNGVVETQKKGLPAKMWYKLIVYSLHNLLSEKYTASGLKSRLLDVQKVEDINKVELRKNTKKETKKDIIKQKSFIPPTLDEIKAYCKSRNSSVDPVRFYEYFTADQERQWIDAMGNPVKSWKQKLVTWESKQSKVYDCEKKQQPNYDYEGDDTL